MKNNIISTDVLIIGSGPGGATVSKQLIENNIDFIIAEEGSECPLKNRSIDTYEVFFRYYQNGGALPIFSSPVFPFASSKIYGGGSEINGGLLWRTPDFILKLWIEQQSISNEMFQLSENIFTKIESDLRVNSESFKLHGNIDSKIIHETAIKNNLLSIKVPKAVIGCKLHNRCASFCTSGAKQSMSQTYLNNKSIKSLTNCKILKLCLDRKRAKYAIATIGNKKNIKIFAKYFFLSAGPIHTPIILRNSGLRENIGNSLQFHHNIKFIVEYNKKIKSQIGTMFNRQIQEFIETKNFVLMSTNYRKNLLASSLESKSNLFELYMKKFDNLGLYTAQIRTLGKGIVRDFFGLGPIVRYKFNPLDLKYFKSSLRESIKIFFDSGAKSIILPLKKNYLINSFKDYEDMENKIKLNDFEMVSVHAMSSVPMGLNKDCPVDFHGKLKYSENIYVSDASVLPSNIGESPQGTIMLFSHFIAKKFVENYNKDKI